VTATQTPAAIKKFLTSTSPNPSGSRRQKSFSEPEGANNEGQYITELRLNARLKANGIEFQNGL